MELDNLKDLWHDLDRKETDPTDDVHILKILQRRSQSPIARMKRNLLLELIAVIILYSFSIWYFLLASRGLYWEIALFLFILGLLFGFYYYKKNRLLGRMQCVTCEVRSNLERQLTTLEKYVRFYFISATVLCPVAYFIPGFIVLMKYPGDAIAQRFTASATYIVFVIIGVVFTGSSYFLNRWYVNKLYGRHIEKLKSVLLQMEEKGLVS